MTEQELWALAVATFDCPFCGRMKGQKCGRVEATYDPELPDLIKPHQPRLDLLARLDGPADGFCAYSAKHRMDGVPATRMIHCGPVAGWVRACEDCAELYGRLGR